MEAFVQMPLETYDVLKSNNEYLKRELKEEQESHSEDVAQAKKEINDLVEKIEKYKQYILECRCRWIDVDNDSLEKLLSDDSWNYGMNCKDELLKLGFTKQEMDAFILDRYEELVNEHFEEKQETNLDHYKDEILENCLDSLAVVKGRPKLCYKTSCNDCDFKLVQKECHNKVKDWLKQTHKKPTYKLTQFEYDLLQHFSVDFKFKEMGLLKEMKEKGHFKNINGDELIKDILESCEVIK